MSLHRWMYSRELQAVGAPEKKKKNKTIKQSFEVLLNNTLLYRKKSYSQAQFPELVKKSQFFYVMGSISM